MAIFDFPIQSCINSTVEVIAKQKRLIMDIIQLIIQFSTSLSHVKLIFIKELSQIVKHITSTPRKNGLRFKQNPHSLQTTA